MIGFSPALDEQYDEFLQLVRDEAGSYLERTLALMQMNWEDFTRLFRTVGHVYGIYSRGRLAGFCWVEQRDRVLHIHGLVLKSEFQGQGIGSAVLQTLESEYKGRVDTVELGVHRSNRRAKALYERLGYQSVRTLDDLGFEIMQKRLTSGSATPPAVHLQHRTGDEVRLFAEEEEDCVRHVFGGARPTHGNIRIRNASGVFS